MRNRLIAVFGSAMYPVIFEIIRQRLPSALSSWSATGKSLKFFCYRTSARGDAITEKPENNADAWRPCWGLTDVDLDVSLRAESLALLAPIRSPAVVEPPCLVKSFVTFGSFNLLEKMNDAALNA